MQLSLRPRLAPAARAPAHVARARVVVRAAAPTAEDVRAALESAARLESSKASKAEVKAAWDAVAAKASAAAAAVFQLNDDELAARSVAADDVLQRFCEANPDALECKVFED